MNAFVIRHNSAAFVAYGWAGNRPDDQDFHCTESESSYCVVYRMETLFSRRNEMSGQRIDKLIAWDRIATHPGRVAIYALAFCVIETGREL